LSDFHLSDLHFAWRDLRGTLRHFTIFLACIALGVFAISGINGLAASLTEGLSREARVILGGDVSFSYIHRQASAAELAFFSQSATVSSTASLRAMARSTDNAALIEIKAVEPSYPPLGTLITTPPLELNSALSHQNGHFGLLVDPILLARLDAKIGDILHIGTLEAEIRGTIANEPDQLGGGLGFGPRVMLLQEALGQTGLLQPGALVRWTYRLQLHGNSDNQLDPFVKTANEKFPDAGWQSRSRLNVSPDFEKNIARFSEFLTLVGLTALMVGGVGVANAVRAFLARKQATIAILKAVGASGRRVFLIMLGEILAVSLIGIFIGLIFGAALPFVVAALTKGLLPFPFTPQFNPAGLALAALYGLLTALTFSVLQLGRAQDVPVAALFRDRISAHSTRPSAFYWGFAALCALALFALAVITTQNHRLAAYYCLGSIAVLLILRGIAALLMLAARKLPHARWLALKLAIGNIHRRGNLTPAVTLSIGLGLTLLVTILQVDASLRATLERGQPGKTPSFFFLDIRGSEAEGFQNFVTTQMPGGKFEQVPMMRGRITKLNDTPAAQIKAEESAAWVLDGDRGITFAAIKPDGSILTKGDWWPADYAGEPLVSFEQGVADGLHLNLGDTITVNVLGRPISARIANFRKVDWRSFGINFVMVFSPNTFKGAPTTYLASLTMPDDNQTQDVALMKKTSTEFPAITSLRVKDALDTAQNLVRQLALGIRAASSIVLIAAILVLGGALSAAQGARTYDAVILKTLGATTKRLLAAYALEYGLIGTVTAVFALLCGLLAAQLIVHGLMNFDFIIAWPPVLLAAFGSIVLIIALGLAGTWRILNLRPAHYLRYN